jgi:hypothetical protein
MKQQNKSYKFELIYNMVMFKSVSFCNKILVDLHMNIVIFICQAPIIEIYQLKGVIERKSLDSIFVRIDI